MERKIRSPDEIFKPLHLAIPEMFYFGHFIACASIFPFCWSEVVLYVLQLAGERDAIFFFFLSIEGRQYKITHIRILNVIDEIKIKFYQISNYAFPEWLNWHC